MAREAGAWLRPPAPPPAALRAGPGRGTGGRPATPAGRPTLLFGPVQTIMRDQSLRRAPGVKPSAASTAGLDASSPVSGPVPVPVAGGPAGPDPPPAAPPPPPRSQAPGAAGPPAP